MLEITKTKIDWAQILDQLRDAGYSGYRVAQILDRKWDTIQNWRHSEPKHADGEALLALHAKVVSRESFPRTGIPANGFIEHS